MNYARKLIKTWSVVCWSIRVCDRIHLYIVGPGYSPSYSSLSVLVAQYSVTAQLSNLSQLRGYLEIGNPRLEYLKILKCSGSILMNLFKNWNFAIKYLKVWKLSVFIYLLKILYISIFDYSICHICHICHICNICHICLKYQKGTASSF